MIQNRVLDYHKIRAHGNLPLVYEFTIAKIITFHKNLLGKNVEPSGHQ